MRVCMQSTLIHTQEESESVKECERDIKRPKWLTKRNDNDTRDDNEGGGEKKEKHETQVKK